jgi:hypothetical protein
MHRASHPYMLSDTLVTAYEFDGQYSEAYCRNQSRCQNGISLLQSTPCFSVASFLNSW